MGLKATTIDEQIDLLKNRGLSVKDDDKAKEYLLDIGYYRLGFYWFYFQNSQDHNFNQNIDIEDIIKLYYLDIDLKNILSKYLYRIEVHFRTQVVYYVSNRYKDSPTWFIDKKIIKENTISAFKPIYDTLKQKNKTILNHHNKYINDKFAPAWKTFEFLTFGQVFKFYQSIQDKNLKNEIANIYGLRDFSLLENYLKSIVNIRNICSHSGILFDYNQPVGIKRIPNKKYRFKNRNQANLNASIRLILYILSKVSQNRADELETKIKDVINKSKANNVLNNIIETKIGFDI
ncbi:Abi family protein [Flavobacterium dauae]|uniref:Abi family protein n=1 Tax=Flavobacterium dauae TaxID=1563479 RepID=UPI00101B3616|nr:Abi family protein [Flavobacterium dauae]WLD23837.1 Abi family protein [Flavobacterium dauae]